ncbi:TPA: glycosyltransferase family 2 protein, partial [Candidatus Poribacteria bacterium]|nr:glycosyltransferase family 2 protein [Candidatus Poribacteria bacterium]
MCNVPVTIGLCVKNCVDTIRKTLNCIIGQNYPHELIEVIVVDDQSSDDTIPLIIKTLSNSSINFKVLSTDGKGLGFARQLVVKNASGKYILWVDGDMILPSNYIMQQVKFMERNPEVGKARAKWGFLNEDSLPAKLESFRVLTHLSGNKSRLLVGIGGSICRTCALKEIGGFDEKIRGAGEDIDLSVRLAISWK